MILALFGLGLIAYAYMTSKQQESPMITLMVWAPLILGIVLLASDTYTSIMLPYQIGKFYNGGTGITYGNESKFGSDDETVAYMMAQTSNEWVILELLKYGAISFMALWFLAFMYNLVQGYSPSGGFKK